MEYHLETCLQEIAASAASILKTQHLPTIEVANPKFGADYAIPCFLLAKEINKTPLEAAQAVTNHLRHPALMRSEAVAGFVNLWLKPAFLAAGIYEDTHRLYKQHGQYGERKVGEGKIAIVEFPSPNMAKPYSVGHLRPAVQGWAIAQLMRAMGYTVITDNHLGDWGTPFGKWVTGFKHYSSDEKLAEKGIYELARVYIKITADLKAEKEKGGHILNDEVQDWLLRLEKGDPEAKHYSELFARISLAHMHAVMERLGIATDYEYGEAFYIPKAKQLLAELIERGIAERQADGSVIVRLDEYGIKTPLLLEKRNGAALYATSDLATLKFRHDTWHPDKVIHVVGSEQQFYFQQIFALAKKLGFNSDYVHHWFGVIDQINDDGTRSKMSSRKGVVLLEELLDIAEKRASSQASEPLDLKNVRRIALGAIKFTDFAQDKKTPILFDWDRVFNLQGFSGPYVQYAAVRVGSILAKFGQGEWADTPYDWIAEKEVVLQLARFPRVVQDAAVLYEPHRIAQYLYELARMLNRYYETTPVGNAEEPIKKLRLWLLSVVRDNFAFGLALLGIEIPEKM